MVENFTTTKTDQELKAYRMNRREWIVLKDCLQFSDDIVMNLKVGLCKYSEDEIYGSTSTLYIDIMKAIFVYKLNKSPPTRNADITRIHRKLALMVHPDKKVLTDTRDANGFLNAVTVIKNELLEGHFENMKNEVDRFFINREDIENTLAHCFGISKNVVNQLLEPVTAGGKRTKKRKNKVQKKSKQLRN
jgi:hypothetical protein